MKKIKIILSVLFGFAVILPSVISNIPRAQALGICYFVGSPGIKIDTGGYGVFTLNGGNPNDEHVEYIISVPKGTVLNPTYYSYAEPSSGVLEVWPGGSKTYLGPWRAGRTHTTAPINETSTMEVTIVNNCDGQYVTECSSCGSTSGGTCTFTAGAGGGGSCTVDTGTYMSSMFITISVTTPQTVPTATGTVAVASNVPTTWDITSAGSAMAILSRSSAETSMSVEGQTLGDYSITNIPLNISNYNGKSWIASSVTPATTQTLEAGNTITFNITYREAGGGGGVDSGTCNASIKSNMPTSWQLSGPDSYSLNGTGDSSPSDLALGYYSLSAGDIPGYDKNISPQTGTCSDGGIMSFTINYSQKSCSGGGLCCSPSSQQVNVSESASFSASGGDSSKYSWSAPGGSPSSGSGDSFSASYSSSGSKTVTLSDTYASAACSVGVCPSGGCGDDSLPYGQHAYANLSNTGGYAADDDSPDGKVTVKIYDGTNFLGSAVASGASHSWSFDLPSSVKDGNVHWIEARAVDYLPGGGSGLEKVLQSSPLRVQYESGTHLECDGNACKSVSGNGANQCIPEDPNGCNPDITHLACLGNSCTRMPGAGSNQCFPIGSACTGSGTHLECVGLSCMWVNGSGPNKNGCQNQGNSCTGGSHLGCDSFTNSCQIIPGGGSNTDECTAIGGQCKKYGCNPDGSCSLRVGGSGNCTPANEENDCPQPDPSCSSFTSDKSKIVVPPSSQITLSWVCSNVKRCELDGANYPYPEVTSAQRTITESMASPKTYTLTCYGRGNKSTTSVLQIAKLRIYKFIGGILREVRPE